MRLNDPSLRHWLWPIVGVVAALMLAFMATTYFSTPPAPLPTPTPRPTETPRPTITPPPTWTPLPTREPGADRMRTTTAAAGETVEEGNLTLTSKIMPAPGAAESDAGSPARQILLDLTIENTGDAVIAINTAREFFLKDDSDQIYKISPTVVAAAGGTIPDVDLGPGERIRAQVGFSTPAAARGLVLNFAADKFKAGRILITLP